MNDRELLERYCRGEISAFEALLERYESSLLRFAGRYRPQTAQDIVQGTFLRLVEATRRSEDGVLRDRAGKPVDNLSAWLYRVTRNLALDDARKEERMVRRLEEVAVTRVEETPTPAIETSELASVVGTHLERLPDNQRDVLVLKLQEDKTYREIAEITGLSVSNVGYLIHQGLKSLSTRLRTAGVV